jgi:hypothetical protein
MALGSTVGLGALTSLAALIALLSLATADTFFVIETHAALMYAWEDNTTWTTASGSVGLPGPDDDVVFVRQNCSLPLGSQEGWVLVLQSNVTVRSATFASLENCLTSFVVGSAGWLRVQSFSATAEARVFLDGGSITAATLLFDGAAYLDCIGRIEGEVVMRGNSTLIAGECRAMPCHAVNRCRALCRWPRLLAGTRRREQRHSDDRHAANRASADTGRVEAEAHRWARRIAGARCACRALDRFCRGDHHAAFSVAGHVRQVRAD